MDGDEESFCIFRLFREPTVSEVQFYLFLPATKFVIIGSVIYIMFI